MLSQYWNWLKKQKEGIGIGALTGLGAFFYYYTVTKPAMASVIAMAVENPSIFDKIASPFIAMPTVQMATIKIAIGFMLLGALIGLILDAIIAPNK